MKDKYICPDEGITEDDLFSYAELISRIKNGFGVDTGHMKLLQRFGKDLKEISEKFDQHLEGCYLCDEIFKEEYASSNSFNIWGNRVRSNVLSLQKGDADDYNEMTIVDERSKQRERFESNHLPITSDLDLIRKLKDYIGKKAMDVGLERPFSEDSDLEEHIKGCDVCKDYSKIWDKNVPYLKKLFEGRDKKK